MGNSLKEFIDALKEDSHYKKIIINHRYVPAQPPLFDEIDISTPLKKALSDSGIERLFIHQAEAIDKIREGHNVVIMTPTASGKSLVYNIPVIESLLKDQTSTGLYIFPLKGLEQNQLEVLNNLLRGSGLSEVYTSKKGLSIKRAEVYDGDTSGYRRRLIREKRPSIILTNPDMVHMAINAYHRKWSDFLRNLKFIVIDELHAYRGIFGSHISHVLRRLKRISKFYGANPQFIACSATIANPVELAEGLTGERFVLIDKSGAPQSARHYILMNPSESPYTEATKLFLSLIKKGFRTILFTKARKITELIYRWSIEKAPELKELISAYRAGFLPEERRLIEKRLFSGETLGVITTSALELGIDIGGLDVCILLGYPGSISSFYQRAGRVGRSGQESAVFFIAIKDSLDQYFMRHPEEFFNKSFEAVVIDPSNPYILRQHLLCASAELSIGEGSYYDRAFISEKRYDETIQLLIKDGLLKRSKKGALYSVDRFPQRGISIRGSGLIYKIRLITGEVIGEIDEWRALKECHPEAIYLHAGRQFRVLRIVPALREVLVTETDVLYYTHPLTEERIEIVEEQLRKSAGSISLRWGIIDITRKTTGFEKKGLFDGMTISRHSVEMPEHRFQTEGLWLIIEKDTEEYLITKGYDHPGSLHAVEHVLISCVPLFAISEKGDIGGLSYPELIIDGDKRPVIFIYDGAEGGAGLTKRLLDDIPVWFSTALRIVEECGCEDGCPSCVQDPQCGNANQPLDKRGAAVLLRRWLNSMAFSYTDKAELMGYPSRIMNHGPGVPTIN
ncbi:MAG: DEAD/DEAH box helicase [Thermodesulfovibrionales bacterium]